MPAPYRDKHLQCPACNGVLREYAKRLICDACAGMLLPHADLAASIRELVQVDVELTFKKPRKGKRTCPCCTTVMTESRLEIHFQIIKKRKIARPTIDHCEHHGVWFDTDELAAVFEKCMKMVSAGPRGGGTSRRSGSSVKMPGNGLGWGLGE